jgi:hypothetical protein
VVVKQVSLGPKTVSRKGASGFIKAILLGTEITPLSVLTKRPMIQPLKHPKSRLFKYKQTHKLYSQPSHTELQLHQTTYLATI